MQSAANPSVRRLWPLLPVLLLTVAVYAAVGSFGFLNLDDDRYVQQNPRVREGLSVEGLRWALTSGHEGVWIPATWISLQADAQVFGPGPGAFHRTNLFLHLVNIALVGLLVSALSGGCWRAVAVAAVFAVHPLNTEAVCWVSARKDLVMAAWSLGAVLCWLRVRSSWRSRWAWAAFACAAVAMAAKPQAVVLPAVLVLAAQWRRGDDGWTPRALGRDLLAVLPFLVVAAATALVAVRLAGSEAAGGIAPVPLAQRVADAPTLVWRFLLKLVRPAPLAPVYPAAGLHVPGAWGAAWLSLLATATGFAFAWRRALPAAPFGWLWFLAWLLPTLGLVQGGQLLLGDRYAYLAMVGVVLLVVEAAAATVTRRPRLRAPLLALLLAAVGLGAAKARVQAGHWRDPVDLWLHTLAVTRDNALAHQNLAVLLDDRGRPAEAWPHLQAALALEPSSLAHFNAGNVLLELERRAEAEAHYRQALARDPRLVEAALNLGSLLGQDGRLDEARSVLVQAETQDPDRAAVQYNLGLVAWLAGDRTEAATRLRRTLELDPGHTRARELLERLARP